MKMKLYICGPVSLGGTCTPEQELENTAKFHEAERQLIAAGYGVESPAKAVEFCARLGSSERGYPTHVRLPGDGACPPTGVERWQWYLRRTIIQMLTCDGLALLDGWKQSRGCVREVRIADDLGIPVRSADAWLRLAADPGLCAHLNIVNVREWRGLDMGSGLFIGDCADCKSTVKVEKP